MKAKLIGTVLAAALLGLSSASWAQSSSSSTPADKAKSPTSSAGSASAGSSAVPAKCAAMTGAEREKCIRDEKNEKNAAAGNGGSTAAPKK